MSIPQRSPNARDHPGGVDGAIIRGGVISGLTQGGTTRPILADSPGELRVVDLETRELLGQILLELRAVRLGIERQLELDPGTLLEEAQENS